MCSSPSSSGWFSPCSASAPIDIYGWVERAVLRIYDMGWEFFTSSLDYLIAGALIVVPLFLIARLFRLGGRRRQGVSERYRAEDAAAVRPFEVTHRPVFRLAVPMTLAYLTTPLVGVVDTAVIGQLGVAALIGGIAIGALIFDVLFASFNFLRSGTTGLTAQAVGARRRGGRAVGALSLRADRARRRPRDACRCRCRSDESPSRRLAFPAMSPPRR